MKHVIFDFDGTIADTMPHILDIAEEVSGLIIDRSEVDRLRNMPIKAILKEYKIPLHRIPRYLIQGKKLLGKRTNEIELVSGLREVLEKLHGAYDMQIVSSNSAPIIVKFLRRHKIEKYFSSVHGNVGLFSKAQALKKIIKKQKYDIADCIYIGDELRDVEAAHKIGLKIISVAWGFNGSTLLRSAKPDRIANRSQEIPLFIEQLLPPNK